MSANLLVALLYLAAVIVLGVAWIRAALAKATWGLGYLAAALALLAYAIPALQAGFK